MSSPINPALLDRLRETVDGWLNRDDAISAEEIRETVEAFRELLDHSSENATARDVLRRANQQLRLDYTVAKKKKQFAEQALEIVLETKTEISKTARDATTELIGELRGLSSTLHETTSHYERLSDQHRTLHAQNSELHSEATDLNVGLDETRQQLIEQQQDNETLKGLNIQLQHQLQEKADSATAAERFTHQLKEDQDALRVQLEKVQALLLEKENRIEELSQEVEGEDADAGQLERHERARKWLETIQGTILELQTEIRNLEVAAPKDNESQAKAQDEIDDEATRVVNPQEITISIESRDPNPTPIP